MVRTPQQAAEKWAQAVNAKGRNYMQEPTTEEQYESVRESYARGNTTFEELGRRVDELLACGL